MNPRSVLLLIAGTFIASAVAPVSGQTIHFGVDVASRYIFRGTDQGSAPAIKPFLLAGRHGFEIGTLGSYLITPQTAEANLQAIRASYTKGPLTLGVTDLYFPYRKGEWEERANFFNFRGNLEGAHFIEPYVSVGSTSTLPIRVFMGYTIHNDPDHPLYLHVSYPFSLGETNLSLELGASGRKSSLYRNDNPAIIEVILSASGRVPLSDTLSLPIGLTYILNPHAERSYLVFHVSL